jgi:hypothetical protein
MGSSASEDRHSEFRNRRQRRVEGEIPRGFLLTREFRIMS